MFGWVIGRLRKALEQPTEDGYILEWRGQTYLRLPATLLRGYHAATELPDESPLLADEFFETKKEAGLSIMDDDTHGFILLTLKKDGPGGDIAIHGHMPREYETPLHMTLVRMLVTGQEMKRGA